MNKSIYIDPRARLRLMEIQCKSIEEAHAAGIKYAEDGNRRLQDKQPSIIATAFLMGFDAWHRDRPFRVLKEHGEAHAVCPLCGSDGYIQTCVGIIGGPTESRPDTNRCECPCGWVGIVHDLVPFKGEA